MENRLDSPFHQLIQKTTKFISLEASHSDDQAPVMPLYQIIRFANQAADKRQVVVIDIEKKISPDHYVRVTLKGVFHGPVNKNRQITFSSHSDRMLYLLKIDQILTIQLASKG